MMVPAIFRARAVLIALTSSAILLLVSLTLILASAGGVAEPLVLHMGKDGADLFGGAGSLYGLWGLGVIMVLVNAFLGARLFNSARALSYALFAGNVLIAVLLLIAIGTVVSMN